METRNVSFTCTRKRSRRYTNGKRAMARVASIDVTCTDVFYVHSPDPSKDSESRRTTRPACYSSFTFHSRLIGIRFPQKYSLTFAFSPMIPQLRVGPGKPPSGATLLGRGFLGNFRALANGLPSACATWKIICGCSRLDTA